MSSAVPDAGPELIDLEGLAIDTLRHTLEHGNDPKLKAQVAEDILDRLPKTAKRALPGQVAGRRQTNLFIAAGSGGQDLMKGLGSFLNAVTEGAEGTDASSPSTDPAATIQMQAQELAPPSDPMEERLRAEGLLDDD